MSKLVPASRPKATRENLDNYLSNARLITAREKVIIVGIRGYYKNTFGKPFENDRNFYDDAMFILTTESMASFNCNVDPSKFKNGIACLVEGIYKVIKWKHRGKYKSLQIVKDIVKRDNITELDAGRHGINFHYGGDNDTWSEGCQTFPQNQYWQFQGLVYELMDTHKLKEVTYLLVSNA